MRCAMTDKERIAIGDELIALMQANDAIVQAIKNGADKNKTLADALIEGLRRERELKNMFFGRKE